MKDGQMNKDEFHYEILNHIGILSTSNSGWCKELNVVKWNDANPKIDIREWDSEHEKMSRGTSLNIKEAEKLRELLLESDFSTMVLG
ncbi:MAG: YdbC family protein [Saccharofermentanales bacterium]